MDEETRNYYLSQGIVLLNGLLDKSEAVEVLSRIEFISTKTSRNELKLLINSPGGVAEYSLIIYEELKKLEIPVATACAGMADGSAALLLASGTKGLRYASEKSIIHIADVWSAKDSKSSIKENEDLTKLRNRFIEIWMDCTLKDEYTVRNWIENQKRFNAYEAVEAGIIDSAISIDDISGGRDGSILRLFRC